MTNTGDQRETRERLSCVKLLSPPLPPAAAATVPCLLFTRSRWNFTPRAFHRRTSVVHCTMLDVPGTKLRWRAVEFIEEPGNFFIIILSHLALLLQSWRLTQICNSALLLQSCDWLRFAVQHCCCKADDWLRFANQHCFHWCDKKIYIYIKSSA